MTQKERMLALLDYDATDKKLAQDRSFAKDLCFDINNTRPSMISERMGYFKKLIGKYNDNFYIEPPFHCDYGYNISLGKNFYANHNLVILDCANVTIGDYVFIAPHVGIYTAGHPIDPAKRNTFIEDSKPITIGNNVWIGGGVTILPGVNIGDNVVIGGGSVVVKDIPPNVVAVGNPCKPIKELAVNQEELNAFYNNPDEYRAKILTELGIC